MSHLPVYEARHTPMLLEVVRDHIRATHYSRRTEQSYTGWIHRYVMFHGNRHPRDMEGPEVEVELKSKVVYGMRMACQDQAAIFCCCDASSGSATPSLKTVPLSSSAMRSAPWMRRHDFCACCTSLKASPRKVVRERQFFVWVLRWRTVANVDSTGLLVRR